MKSFHASWKCWNSLNSEYCFSSYKNLLLSRYVPFNSVYTPIICNLMVIKLLHKVKLHQQHLQNIKNILLV